MIKDSIVNLKKSLRMTLQNVPAVVDTLIRGLDEVEDAADELSTYSTTDEKVVGTWINGKPIYEKTVNFGTLPNTDTSQKAHGIADIDQVIGIEGIAINDTNVSINLPYASTGANTSLIVNRTVILITTESNRNNYTGYITVRYTKLDSNRAQENDTKNVIEDEITLDPAPVEDLKK